MVKSAKPGQRLEVMNIDQDSIESIKLDRWRDPTCEGVSVYHRQIICRWQS